MSFTGFTPSDFKVFEIPGFKPRMDAIKARIRPKSTWPATRAAP